MNIKVGDVVFQEDSLRVGVMDWDVMVSMEI